MIRKEDLSNHAVEAGSLTTRPAVAAKSAEAARDVFSEPKVTVAELARAWRVREETILRDIRKGALRAHRLPSGDWRILLSDARAYGRPNE